MVVDRSNSNVECRDCGVKKIHENIIVQDEYGGIINY